MTITTLNILNVPHCLFATRKALADEYGISERTVDNRMKEIEAERERYGKYAVLKEGYMKVVNYLVWVDYMKNRQALREKNLRKHVDAFDPEEVARAIGLYGAGLSEEEG